jgi:crescentin
MKISRAPITLSAPRRFGAGLAPWLPPSLIDCPIQIRDNTVTGKSREADFQSLVDWIDTMAWALFKNVAASPSRTAAPSNPPPQEEAQSVERKDFSLSGTLAGRRAPAPPKPQRSSLDAIGQRNEVVRQRISEMVDRLEDLKTLQDDFSSILDPITTIAEELSRSSMRNAELDTLLAQEQQSAAAVRREVSDLGSRVASLANELADAQAWGSRIEGELHDREATIEELRISLRDKSLAAENFERQLFAETEKAKAVLGESKALRQETQAMDQALSRSEHELTEARERINLLDAENRRLQLLTEEQSVRLIDLSSRFSELEATADAERQALRTVEAKLSSETALREKSEAQYEAEVGEHRTERASLAMKLEAVTNRAAATEQLLNQLRHQLREKDEAARLAERNFKEASIERVTAERRLEGMQADVARQTERYLDLQRQRSELDSRCDMLTKALAAKDAAIEQATTRSNALGDRIEQITRRYESERAELEAVNRRLTEELQNERSERVMALGALDIARESRLTLQKQHEALKRSARGWRNAGNADGEADAEAAAQAEQSSNVRSFASPGKSN